MRGGKVIACIEDPAVIKKILDHLKQKSRDHRARSTAREPGTTGWRLPTMSDVGNDGYSWYCLTLTGI